MKQKTYSKMVDSWIAFYENKWSKNRTEKAKELLVSAEKAANNYGFFLNDRKSAELCALRILASRVHQEAI